MPPLTRAALRLQSSSPPPPPRRAPGASPRPVVAPPADAGAPRLDLRGDRRSLALLLLLYTLQGVPMGLAASVSFLLHERGASLAAQGVFSFVSWPFSLKVLWAPLVDSLYVPRFGQRRSWLVPVQAAVGLLLLAAAPRCESLLGSASSSPDVGSLTALFFWLYVLCATQDIAVDGWALTLLSRRNVGLASPVNAAGQALGVLAAFTGYTALSEHGLVGLRGFLSFWGVAFVASAALVAATPERRRPRRATAAAAAVAEGEQRLLSPSPPPAASPRALRSRHAAAPVESRCVFEDDSDGGEGGDGDGNNAAPPSIAHVYGHAGRLLLRPPVRRLMVILLTCRTGFAATDALFALSLASLCGLSKARVAGITAALAPVSLLLPLALARAAGGSSEPQRQQNGDRTQAEHRGGSPWRLFMRCYAPRLAVGVASAALVWHGSRSGADGDTMSEQTSSPARATHRFALAAALLLCAREALSTAQFTAQMAFFARVADPAIGAWLPSFV